MATEADTATDTGREDEDSAQFGEELAALVTPQWPSLQLAPAFVSLLARSSKGDPQAALASLQRYLQCRRRHTALFQHYEPAAVAHLLDTGLVVALDTLSPLGQVVVFRLGAWTPAICPLNGVCALLLLVIEALSLDETRRQAGFVALYDLHGLSLAHMRAMTARLRTSLLDMLTNYLFMPRNLQVHPSNPIILRYFHMHCNHQNPLHSYNNSSAPTIFTFTGTQGTRVYMQLQRPPALRSGM